MRQRRESLQPAPVVLDNAVSLAMNHRSSVQTIVRANDNRSGSARESDGSSRTWLDKMYQNTICRGVI